MSDVRRRMNRIFNNGKSFVVACDHGMISGPIKGVKDMGWCLDQVIAGGADGVMATYGTAVRFPEKLSKVGLVLRIDGTSSILAPSPGAGSAWYSIEDALRVGAEALCVTSFTATEYEEEHLKTLAKVIRKGHEWGIPVMAEMMPGGFEAGPEKRTLHHMKTTARVAAELGADWVKIPYCDDFEEVVDSCYVPVVVLGGVNNPDKLAVLTMIEQGLKSGSSGATVGRNVWQSDNPQAMTRAIHNIIHEGWSAEQAVALLDD
ncbi:deoxyribose-phosphate aldolase [Clostridia bacterium]|nr:deoxyribose-phosphate aldolase [Clostridia bacterium]